MTGTADIAAYEAARADIEELHSHYSEACNAARDVELSLSERLGVPLDRGFMGLLSDAIRMHPEYRAAQAYCLRLHKARADANRAFVKTFKKQYRADRLAGRPFCGVKPIPPAT